MSSSSSSASLSLSKLKTVDEYLTAFGPELAAKVDEQVRPLYDPASSDGKLVLDLLRKPYAAQADCIRATVQALREFPSVLMVGEMGCGKTLMAAAACDVHFGGRPYRCVIVCPSHLAIKWKRELERTLRDVRTRIFRSTSDLLENREALRKRPAVKEFWIISKDRCKLGGFWKPVYYKRLGGKVCCVDCGLEVRDEYGNARGESYLARTKRVCHDPKCAAPLWGVDPKRSRRYAPVDFIKRYLPDSFQFAIFDEVHQLKGGKTAQGNMLGTLRAVTPTSLMLTGTLAGGYATDVFHLLFRTNPAPLRREGFEFHSPAPFLEKYGVVEHIFRRKADELVNERSRGSKESKSTRVRPGISPAVFSNQLVDRSVFIQLEDLKADLPPLKERVVGLYMDAPLRKAYETLEKEIKDALEKALASGSQHLLSTYLNVLLRYPDHPFGFEPIEDAKQGEVIAVPEELSREAIYRKEDVLVRTVLSELRANRKVWIYAVYTASRDITPRIVEVLARKGVKAQVLRSSVTPEKREEWIERNKGKTDVIISHPKLVEVGMDLIEFPTLVFYETGYSIYTLRQASRRSWRIGQTRPVKIVYLYYKHTIQQAAMDLMGRKLAASLALEGSFSSEGLAAMSQGEDMMTALARSVVKGLRDYQGIETYWKKAQSEGEEEENPPAATPGEAPVFEQPEQPTVITPLIFTPSRPIRRRPTASDNPGQLRLF